MNENREYMGSVGYTLIGAAFEVHREQGGGLSEEIYHESLEMELGFRSIPFVSKQELSVYYKGHILEKKFVPDLYVSSGVVVELKAVKGLNKDHERQLLNYMRVTRKAVGYLINFGPLDQLEWKRYLIKEFIPDEI
ncbi:GxxExxY protein [Coraliomargarita parva]|uniref:GxxExxY protein n=1 Tax=Coraliomargarita parva TaxID=3014050 RepID=UPI0022B3B3DB|nr:GxxExxY protein [Coraliomargarita parva]